jgi:hypothetical protein
MPVDPEYLRRHYASLSDEALLEINRDELVDTARSCLEAELERRQLYPAAEFMGDVEPEEYEEEIPLDEDQPEWLEEGAEVFSAAVRPGMTSAPQAHHAREALRAAGIPCHLEIYEEEAEEPAPQQTIRRWRVLVPGKLNLFATGVLQRDIFNEDFEAGWRTHLEVLSDEEVRELDPQLVFCGLFDQIERVTRAYNDELIRRGMA